MPCGHARQLLLDGGWSERERHDLAAALAHAADCPDCAAALAAFDEMRTAIDARHADAVPAGGWDAFADRLASTVSAAGASPTMTTTRLRRRGTAAAACVVIGVAGFLAGRLGGPASPGLATNGTGTTSPVEARPTTSKQTEARPHVPTPTPGDVARGAAAFAQLSEVFDRRASWMLVSDAGSDVGLSSDVIPPARRLLVLRLTVLRGEAVVSSADLVIVPGRTADLTLPLGGGQELHYQIDTSADPPTRLSLWLELTTPRETRTLAALATNLNLRPGEGVSAGRFTTPAGPYELRVAFADAHAGPAPAPAAAPDTIPGRPEVNR